MLQGQRSKQKKSGSSRISGKTIPSKQSQLEVFEISVTECSADNISDRPIESLYKTICSIFDKVIQDFVPPVFQSHNKLTQIFVPSELGFHYPGRQKSVSFVSGVDLFKYAPELLFE